MMDLTPNRKGRYFDIGNWEQQYRAKTVLAHEAVQTIQDYDVISTTGGGSFPQAFDRELAKYVKETGFHIDLVSNFFLKRPDILSPDLKDQVRYYSFFFADDRNYVSNGNVQFVPIHLGQTGDFILSRKPRVVAFNCSPPNAEGWMSRGIWGAHIDRRAFDSPDCQVVIAEVNSKMPYIHSGGEEHLLVHVSEVDYIVEETYTWPETKDIESTETEKAIAGHIAEMICDGACIQVGLGGLANAIGLHLSATHMHDLGLHSEVLGNYTVELMKKGIINNSKKKILPGKSVAAYVIGDQKLLDFCDNNTDICAKEVRWVNDAHILSQNDNVISINNAMEVDLVGQIASESRGPVQYSATGGQLQWVYASQLSKGGMSIIAINSTYKDKNGVLQSKIKTVLPPGSIVTTPRSCAEYVVTEYGVAHLKYKSTRERAKALISIAHPDFRDELAFEAKKWW